MAVLADVARRHVRRPLARCVDAVVTAEAVARDIRMIEGGRYPAIRGVAVVAGIGTRDMSHSGLATGIFHLARCLELR